MYNSVLSFNKYVLSSYYEPGMALGSEDTALKKTEKVCVLMKIIFQWRETDMKQASKYQIISDSVKVLS